MPRTLVDELLREIASQPDEQINLAAAALLIAMDEYPDLNAQACMRELDELADEVKMEMPFQAQEEPLEALKRINRVLYLQKGFRGNAADYYDPRNSYLNVVLERRTGIPITLSIIYMELGKRIGLSLHGVGMPGHFLLKVFCQSGEFFIDAFHNGEILSRSQCWQRLEESNGEERPLPSTCLDQISNLQILTRLLNNLKVIYFNVRDFPRALSATEKIMILNPNAASELRDRAALHFHLNHFSRALSDWTAYLKRAPDATDAEEVRNNLRTVHQLLAARN
jgi:regulator of sirC expression with transglutaminase-like and TPR domain